MSNAFNTPQELPDPNELGAGVVLQSGPIQRMARSQNHQHALHKCHPVVSQAWPGGDCSRTPAGWATVAQWRVAYVSSAHTDWECVVYGTSTGGLGQVQLTSAKGGVATAVLPAAAGFVTLPIYAGTYGAAAGIPAGLDVLELQVYGGVGVTSTVYQITIQPAGLTSPLAANVVGSFRPVGSNICGNDEPLTAARGRSMVANVEALLDYPRSVFAWSGLSNCDGTPDQAMPNHLHVQWIPVHYGAIARGKTYTVDCLVNPDAVNDTYVQVIIGTGFENYAQVPFLFSDPLRRITIVGGGALGWYSTTFQIPGDHRADPRFPFANTRIGLFPWTGERPGGSTAEIRAASIWGP